MVVWPLAHGGVTEVGVAATGPRRPSRANERLTVQLTHVWFTTTAKNGKVEGGCNFTTVGGIFCFLGFAEHAGRGRYRKVVPQGTK